MTRFNRSIVRTRQQGQTLVIALIVMGVLLVLGLVFLGLINRNILNSARSERRSEASDLAEAGIRYAHGQLVSSPLGADWRGVPTVLAPSPTDTNRTLDPDAYYLRPGTDATVDLGGPDKLGPFIRIPFANGRALVRVRYGASDANPTPSVAGGPLRQPGAARSTLIIESVGRPGVVNPKDPTTLNAQGGLQYRNFADATALNQAISEMAQANAQISTSRRLVAFAPIGIIDAARFETNVFNSSAPIEIGIPDGLGMVAYGDLATANTDVGASLPLQIGTPGDVEMFNRKVQGFGSVYINGDAKFYGNINLNLNQTLGDSVRIAGRASGSPNASLNISTYRFNPATNAFVTGTPFVLTEAGGTSFDSQSPSFSTAEGTFLDGSSRTDSLGFANGIGKLVPPSTLTVDPQTKLNRYVSMTRESGPTNAVTGKNVGFYGQGAGIYVDNTADRQEAVDAEGRKAAGSQRSLFDDWLNPNSGAADSGWKGAFYVPRGAVLQLLPDGWVIQRDGSAPVAERTWKNLDGTDSGLTTIRYRVGRLADGSLRTLNTLTVPDINAIPLNFTTGAAMPFNGVIYFEGNVRVRGTIPTGVQMTVVSGATIYIDGSIVKGITRNEVTDQPLSPADRGRPINGLPTATLMLMAKDNVALNTSMFLGPDTNQTLESVNDVSGATGISPVRLRAAGGSEAGKLGLITELVMDPNNLNGTPAGGAQNWTPYALTYRSWDLNAGVPTQLMLGATMDDGTASASFFALDVNFGGGTNSGYLFDSVDAEGLITNTAAAYLGNGSPTTEIYGLGAEPWQRYSRFEFRNFALLPNPAAAIYNANTGVITPGGTINYFMASGANDLLIRPGSIASVSANDTLIGRAALAPLDVKIEASIFAEQGSFFIIPGPWFNPNPNDTHAAYEARVTNLTATLGNATAARLRAARERLEAYGTAPWVPFYGEPLDIRINIVGSVAENLPPPISIQAEWVRKWGWIPRRIGATGVGIPIQHVPGQDAAYLTNGQGRNFVPNLVIQYDPVLATGSVNDVNQRAIRRDELERPLPPMPRLPVSPRLAYFGEL